MGGLGPLSELGRIVIAGSRYVSIYLCIYTLVPVGGLGPLSELNSIVVAGSKYVSIYLCIYT